MLFRSRPDLIVFVLPNDLVFHDPDGRTAHLSLPPAISSRFDLHDHEAYARLLANFLKSAAISKRRVLILMSEALTFHRSERTGADAHPDTSLIDFTDKVPLEPAKRKVVTCERNGHLLMCATSTDLYRPLAEGLSAANKVMACVPAISFNLYGKKLERDACKQLFAMSAPAAAGDFLAGD